ncbi:PrgI family protein [Phytoactinopolyspora alkaliphila]|uniref:PrgI family protein n=1 Tax=Phytoactinopolyspora alkaliphila TaxID=1783498 RepID=A0A6N9YQD0_9ACTN|nr:SCO6880 family protein [Phytoactinopolyspora alkaliphila]NED97140.1 PrgI family protein [Phytoactinopolyspora alkaliphila]
MNIEVNPAVGAGKSLVSARLGRRSERGVMWGLTAAQLYGVGVAAAVLGPAMMSAGMRGLLVSAPVWASALIAAFVRPNGRTAASWAPVVANYVLRRIRGQDTWLADPERPRRAGVLALPGELTGTVLYVHSVTAAAMIHDPRRRTLTAVARLRHSAFLLLSHDDQNRRVAGWRRALSGAARTGRVARLQVLERCMAEGGEAIRAYWREEGCDDSSAAASSYRELIGAAAPASARHDTLIAVTVALKNAPRIARTGRGGATGAASVLAKEMASLTAGLNTAEITVESWLDEHELAYVINTAFRPHRAPVWERTGLGRDPSAAGPVAVSARWDHVRIDDGWHAVVWIREWPREDIDASFLVPLVLTASVQRTISVFYRPRTAREAARDIRVELAEQESEQRRRNRNGTRTSAVQQRENDDVERRERELVAGHADLAYTGLVAISATSKDDLNAAVEETENACHQAGLDTTILYGQQDAAFYAAALPLGRVNI